MMNFKGWILILFIVFAGCNSSGSITEQSLRVKPSLSASQNVITHSPTIETVDKKKEIGCTDIELSNVWQELQTDEDIRAIIIDEGLEGDCSDFIKIAGRSDLNSDGVDELFVEGTGSWGAASTLPIWVMQKGGASYTVILREQGENYSVEKHMSNGYLDLFFPSRRSITSSTLSTYRFKNDKYERAICKIEFENIPKKLKKVVDCSDEKGIEKAEAEIQ